MSITVCHVLTIFPGRPDIPGTPGSPLVPGGPAIPCAVQENYLIYKMNNCMLSIGYTCTTPKRKIWSAYPPSRCGISDLYHSTIKGPPPSNNSIYDADYKKEQDYARFCSRQRESWATCRLLQMLKSFLGPSVDHSTSLTGVASFSWIKCISEPRPWTHGSLAILLCISNVALSVSTVKHGSFLFAYFLKQS